MKTSNLFFVIIVFFFGSVALSLFTGAVSAFDSQVFWLLRLPRTILGVAVGGGLAVSGALVQASLGNPLADPYTIGVASAAALGAVIGSFMHHPLGIAGTALAFSIAFLLLLTAWLKFQFRHSIEVLLVGIISGFFLTSLAALIMALADPSQWSSAVGWLMGTLKSPEPIQAVMVLSIIVFGCLMAWMHWKPLDVLSIDETAAESVGLDVGMFRRRIFFLIALITSICVSIAGIIGFVGLIVPHLLRRLGIRSHHLLLPASFLVGASILISSDSLARFIVRPSELPVGIVMALIGAPVFLWIARRRVPLP